MELIPLLLFEPKNKNCVEIPLMVNGEKTLKSLMAKQHIEVSIVENNQLNIVFWKEFAENVEIGVFDQEGKTIYSLQTYTVPSLHLFVDVSNWISGVYDVVVCNAEFCSFKGNFILQKN